MTVCMHECERSAGRVHQAPVKIKALRTKDILQLLILIPVWEIIRGGFSLLTVFSQTESSAEWHFFTKKPPPKKKEIRGKKVLKDKTGSKNKDRDTNSITDLLDLVHTQHANI